MVRCLDDVIMNLYCFGPKTGHVNSSAVAFLNPIFQRNRYFFKIGDFQQRNDLSQ